MSCPRPRLGDRPTKKSPRIPDRWKLFAMTYIKNGFNAGRAYESVGYSARGDIADASAARLLGNEKVRALVDAERARLAKIGQLSNDEIVRELSVVAGSDLSEFSEWNKNGVKLKSSESLDPVRRRAVSEVSEVKDKKNGRTSLRVKLHDKVRALQTLAQIRGMVVTRLGNASGDDPLKIEVVHRHIGSRASELQSIAAGAVEADALSKPAKKE